MLTDRRAKRAYARCPIALQNCLVTGYGYRQRRRKYGDGFHRCLAQLMRNERLSGDDLRRLQDAQLRSIVNHAQQSVPYYRDLFRRIGLSGSQVRGTDDLRRLPTLSKEIVRANGARLVSERLSARDRMEFHTSGTTGKALDIAVDSGYFRTETAFRWRHKSWAGIEMGDTAAYFTGMPVVPVAQTEPPFWRSDATQKRVFYSVLHMSPENLGAYVDALDEHQAVFLRGYPSSLFVLAAYLKETGRRLRCPPRAIFSSSETLFPRQREVIEESLGSQVFNWYGLTEMVANIVECEKGSLHICLDYGVVEFLNSDGRPAQAGEEGEIVATGLGNYAMPLLRYRTGDLGIPSDAPCPCGRPFPVVAKLLGRNEDVITTPSGRLVGRLDFVFKQTRHVKEAQIVQEERGSVQVRVVRRQGYSDSDTKAIVAELTSRLGADVHVQVVFLDGIPRDAAGKFRYVVSRVADG